MSSTPKRSSFFGNWYKVKRVLGLGAGGHAKVVMEILGLGNDSEIVGLLDANQDLWGTKVLGIPVLGDDSLLSRLYDQNIHYAFIGVGSVGDTCSRKELYEKVRGHGFKIVPAIHPRAVISHWVEIGDGPTIMAGAVINVSAKLGDNVIVNTGAIIEHDCIIGDHVHIATGARLASTVTVGEGSHIGIGATVKQCVRIGRDAIVGAGAVVVNDVPNDVVVVGEPARILRSVEK